MDRLKIKEAQSRPLQGPWYYIYLKPNWVFKTMPGIGYDTIDHTAFWRVIVDEIAKHYEITNSSIIRELKELPYSMPRGRVSEGLAQFGGKKTWFAHHGFDFSGTNQKQIISAFNLGYLNEEHRVKFAYDEHHKMQKYDFMRFNTLVSKLDAKNMKKINIENAEEEARKNNKWSLDKNKKLDEWIS